MVDWDKRNRRDRARRALGRKITREKLTGYLQNPEGLKRLAQIEETQFQKARDWSGELNSLADEFNSDVVKLVHLAMRRDSVDEENIRGELVKSRQRAYEDELKIQLGRAGCNDGMPKLTTGPTLTGFFQEATEEAKSIVNTYNAELVTQIRGIREKTPPANRNVYVKRLGEWDRQRATVKGAQVSQWVDGRARASAVRDFFKNNNLEATAELEPKSAKEPICEGWINRGRVPISEATANDSPFHPNCPHYWVTYPAQVPKGECSDLWIGE